MLEQEYRSLQRLMEIAELRQKGIQDTHLLDWNFRVAEDTPYVQMGKRYVNNWKMKVLVASLPRKVREKAQERDL